MFTSTILLFFTLEYANASILSIDIKNLKKESFKIKDICQEIAPGSSLLVGKQSRNEFDCMGKIFVAKNLCQQKISNPRDLVLARVDDEFINCIKGKQVIVKYHCQNKDFYCQNAKIGCEKLRGRLAYNFPIMHSSILDDGSLNCIYIEDRDLFSQEILERPFYN